MYIHVPAMMVTGSTTLNDGEGGVVCGVVGRGIPVTVDLVMTVVLVDSDG